MKPKCPPTNGRVIELWPIHTIEYYLVTKRNDVLIRATTWMNLENMMLSEGPWVLVCWRCHSKVPHTPGDLRNGDVLSPSFWRLEAQGQGVSSATFSRGQGRVCLASGGWLAGFGVPWLVEAPCNLCFHLPVALPVSKFPLCIRTPACWISTAYDDVILTNYIRSDYVRITSRSGLGL